MYPHRYRYIECSGCNTCGKISSNFCSPCGFPFVLVGSEPLDLLSAITVVDDSLPYLWIESIQVISIQVAYRRIHQKEGRIHPSCFSGSQHSSKHSAVHESRFHISSGKLEIPLPVVPSSFVLHVLLLRRFLFRLRSG